MPLNGRAVSGALEVCCEFVDGVIQLEETRRNSSHFVNDVDDCVWETRRIATSLTRRTVSLSLMAFEYKVVRFGAFCELRESRSMTDADREGRKTAWNLHN